MVIKQVLNILNQDAELTNLIGKNHIYLAPTNYTGEAIVYSFVPVSSDKIKRLDRLEMNVITDTASKGFEIEERLKHLLLTFGDQPLLNGIQDCYLNGGGNIFDYERQKYHKILYFYILSKE